MNPKASFENRFRELAAGYYTLRFAGLFTAAGRHNSTSKLQRTLFLKFGSHYNLPIPLRFRNWSFTIKLFHFFTQHGANRGLLCQR